MRKFGPRGLLNHRIGLTFIGLLVVLGIAGCGSAPASPTRPVAVLPTVSTTLPTAPAISSPLPPELPTAVTPLTPTATLVVTATMEVVTPTAAVTERPRATVARTSAPAGSTAPTGRIAYTVVSGNTPRLHTLWIANVDGTGARQILESAGWPALSPDGKRLAFFHLSVGVTNPGLYLANSDGGNITPIVIGPGVCCINWSHDGSWLVYANSFKPSQPGGVISMIKMDGFYKTVIDLKVQGNGPSFSPDGKQIVFSGCVPNTNTCGVLATLTDGAGVVRTLTSDNGGNAHWSPRGDRIVYQGTDSLGNHQVFVINPDGSGKKQLTSGRSNDGQPVWSRDGGSIFWRSDQNGTGWAIFRMNADGSNPRRVIQNAAPDSALWAWESLSLAP